MPMTDADWKALEEKERKNRIQLTISRLYELARIVPYFNTLSGFEVDIRHGAEMLEKFIEEKRP